MSSPNVIQEDNNNKDTQKHQNEEEYTPPFESEKSITVATEVTDKVEVIFEDGVIPFGSHTKDNYYGYGTSTGSFSTSTNTPPCTIRRCCMTNYWMAIFCILSVEREWSSERNIFECSIRM